MTSAADSLIWISGATSGLGSGLVRTCPYQNARIINLSRSGQPGLDNVSVDLTDPATWGAVRESFARELSGFRGTRAVFIHNAATHGAAGFAGEVHPEKYYEDVIGNAAAPLVLADMFLRAVRPGYESGLVLMSSAAARSPFEGRSVYCAAKAGVEQWVRVVRRERARRGQGPWVVAVRPGFVDSPSVRMLADADPAAYPGGPALRDGLADGEALHPDDAARAIWAALPPPPDTSVLLFGAPPSGMTRASAGAPRG
jgi:benzil reductase ((S)-benzoin forming)